jgi:hypothetical protein
VHACRRAQLRVRCLEALLQLLQALDPLPPAADPAGAATLKAADGGSLAAAVAACLATVSAQDPSMAHKALAGQAAAVLQRVVPPPS